MAYVRVTFLLRRLFTLEKFPARVCQQLTGRIRTDERGTRVGNKTLNVNDAIQGSRAAVLLNQPTIHNNCLRPTVTVITTPTHFRPGDTTEKTERRGISVQKILPFIVDIGSRRNIVECVVLLCAQKLAEFCRLFPTAYSGRRLAVVAVLLLARICVYQGHYNVHAILVPAT